MADLVNCWYADFGIVGNPYVTCGEAEPRPELGFAGSVNEFSIQFWMRTTVNDGSRHILVSRARTSESQYTISHKNDLLEVILGTGELSNGSWTILTETGSPINGGTWRHVVLSVGLSSAVVYVDGIAMSSTITPSGPVLSPVSTLIGARRGTTNTDFLELYGGSIDEVGFWNTALSAAAVSALYNSGTGLMLDQNSGSYTASKNLVAWYRLGDGTLENAGSVPTNYISDMSGNGLDARLYGGAAPFALPGNIYGTVTPVGNSCLELQSSSTAVGTHFRIVRSDQSNLRGTTGYESSIYRMRLDCYASLGISQKVFVYEYGRPVPGTSIRREVFRRVAKLQDLVNIPEDVAQPVWPFAFRTDQADLYADSVTKLDSAWLEIQRQAAALSIDMMEFGVPVDNRFRAGQGNLVINDQQDFNVPSPLSVGKSSSSSIPAVFGSSSSSIIPIFGSSSSSVPAVLTSSSSSTPGPDIHANFFIGDVRVDAASIHTDIATKTLYTDMGLVRFGRDADPDSTWDTFLRFKIDIPKCSLIKYATLEFTARTAEFGNDVLLGIYDIYESGYTSINEFADTVDPPIARKRIVWDRLPTVAASGTYSSVDIVELLQFFVDRTNYTPDVDYFGLWIKELVSDPGARRDATLLTTTPYLRVKYGPNQQCPSSSVPGP